MPRCDCGEGSCTDCFPALDQRLVYTRNALAVLCGAPADNIPKEIQALIEHWRPQIIAFGADHDAEIRRLALEEAAQVIDREIQLREKFDLHIDPIDELAKQIRALAACPASSTGKE